MAQKGFQTSELLMADSVALLRRKIEDLSLAVQDGTINSVITLAAIEVSFTLQNSGVFFEPLFNQNLVWQGEHNGQRYAC